MKATGRRRARLQGGVLAALLLVAPGASAQKTTKTGHKKAAEPPPLAASLQGEAKEAYGSAELLFNHGDYAGAVTKYQQAYELSHDARLLFDEAIAEKNMHAYARMQRHLQEYAAAAGPTMTADDRAAVDGALAAIRNLVGTIEVKVDEAGAAVVVDGDPVGETPLPEPPTVDLGKHTVVISKPDFEPVTRAIDVTGGSAVLVQVVLTRQIHTAGLLVTAEPGAVITIDGQTTARDRFDAQVPAGTHEVRVTAPDRVPYVARVELREHETRSLEVTLARASHGGALWPWIVGGAAI
ncbi:MAG: PEGA domain-containing protein, partial [Polyangiaceae bacterium]